MRKETSVTGTAVIGEVGASAVLAVVSSVLGAAGIGWMWRLSEAADADPLDGAAVAFVVASVAAVVGIGMGALEGIRRRPFRATVVRWVFVGLITIVGGPLLALSFLVPGSYISSDPAGISLSSVSASVATGTAIVSALLVPVVWPHSTSVGPAGTPGGGRAH